jgi:hypothetical protein
MNRAAPELVEGARKLKGELGHAGAREGVVSRVAEASGWASGRCRPEAPTDPDVRISRIRFFRSRVCLAQG